MSEAEPDFVGELPPVEVPDFSVPAPPVVAVVEPATGEPASELPAPELPAGPHCCNCRHFKPHEQPREYHGECRRYPPDAIVVLQNNIQFWFRQVKRGDYCGEHIGE
jgi:hypothetical protein